MSIKEHPPLHVPVLLEDCLRELAPKSGEKYLDLTAGYGGHASAMLQRTDNYSGSVLVDRDTNAILTLGQFSEKGTRLMQVDFAEAAKQLVADDQQFDVILLDLGVSSPQLDIPSRGFSFMKDGPLDMRMDNRQDLTAETIVNTAKRSELSRIIHEYGEEPQRVATRYANAIIAARPVQTTGQLAEVIRQAHVGKWQKIHPATRTFQAIRIQVNDELRQVSETLPLLPKLLKKDGRVGVISFHSLEDRIVKRYFAEQKNAGYEAELRIQTKHPIDGATHDVHNPRSRSAKLRVAVKI
ncbi:16S rRNA (cytosine(1402)-N(4))-methyltransferase RsmH [Candidatus Saccharibacteria bacterium]|nr:16S rRNA (cytosine(1402)-N(4))-methyltransferase RsmH [Candidatus Saccharibacteria bacterium]MCA9336872.1 16S rRNA (cytosine(1402)-N(4))-methyltransferase RsmH [Candidatus Saccharibacteria bacterium]